MNIGSATLPAPVQAIVICAPRLPLPPVASWHDAIVIVRTGLAAVAALLAMPAAATEGTREAGTARRRAVPVRAESMLVIFIFDTPSLFAVGWLPADLMRF